jgi:hypothetical protein
MPDFLARDGVCRHEGTDAFAQGAAGCVHHVALGAAHVHHQHTGFEDVANGAQRGLGGRYRHGDQHDVGACSGQQGGFRSHVDHTQLARAFRRRRRLAVAHHPLDEAGALEGQRK